MNNRSTSKTAVALASCALLAAMATPAAARMQAGEHWSYEFAPYLWAAGLDGTTRSATCWSRASTVFQT